MSTLLSIVIPTYNRAPMLDKQLSWLAKVIQGHEAECEIIIYDNCSSDNTQDIVSKWQPALHKCISFNYHQQKVNIGGMKNMIACLQAATGKYVWTLGDDDPMQLNTLDYILKTLKQHPQLTLLLLNGNGRDIPTNKIVVERWFNINTEKPSHNSKLEYQYYLKNNMGGLLFISAAIYETKLVQEALQTWTDSDKNLAAQAYWTAYCAARGSFMISENIYTEAAMGNGYTDKDPKWTFKMELMYIPEVYLKLMKLGFSKQFCLNMIMRNFKSINSWKILIGGLRRWFLFTLKGTTVYLNYVIIAIWISVFNQNTQVR